MTSPNIQGRPLACIMVFLFFGGICCTLTNALIPCLRDVMNLKYSQVMLVQVGYYLGYFLGSPLAGKRLEAIGYRRNIMMGMFLSALGCTLVLPAVQWGLFSIFCLSTFFIGSGYAFLQVSGNPLAVQVGDKKTAASRMTLVHAFYAMGTGIGPILGAYTILKGACDPSVPLSLHNAPPPYLGVALIWLVLTVFIMRNSFPKQPEHKKKSNEETSLWNNTPFVLSWLAIFIYVGGEVCLGTLSISYMAHPELGGLAMQTAGSLSGLYWFGMMTGRFAGSWLLQHFSERQILLYSAVGVVACVAVSLTVGGVIGVAALLLTGLCHSVTYPTIMTIGLKQAGSRQQAAAGYLCMANIGGAVGPVIQGAIADQVGLLNSFFVPLVIYGVLFLYASQLKERKAPQLVVA